MLKFYQGRAARGDLRFTIFGPHRRQSRARKTSCRATMKKPRRAEDLSEIHFSARFAVGGTISASTHRKLKRDYLRELYGEDHLREMAP